MTTHLVIGGMLTALGQTEEGRALLDVGINLLNKKNDGPEAVQKK